MPTPIDLSALPRFGSMTSGGGLAAIFDGNPATAGYSGVPSGWAGVTFAEPVALDFAEFISATNGFDGSGYQGANSNITVRLRGIQSPTAPQPTQPTDGELIGTVGPFQDVNATTTRNLDIPNKPRTWTHVWAHDSSDNPSTFSILSALKLYAYTAPSPPTEPPTSTKRKQSYKSKCNTNAPLQKALTPIPGFPEIVAKMEVDSVLTAEFTAALAHVGDTLSPQYLDVVGCGVYIQWAYATTLAGLATATWSSLAAGSEQIRERNPQHYGWIGAREKVPVPGGYFKFRIAGSGHTTSSDQNGIVNILAEGIGGLNLFTVEFDKDEELMA